MKKEKRTKIKKQTRAKNKQPAKYNKHKLNPDGINLWIDMSMYTKWMVLIAFNSNDDLICQKPLDPSTAGNAQVTSTSSIKCPNLPIII